MTDTTKRRVAKMKTTMSNIAKETEMKHVDQCNEKAETKKEEATGINDQRFWEITLDGLPELRRVVLVAAQDEDEAIRKAESDDILEQLETNEYDSKDDWVATVVLEVAAEDVHPRHRKQGDGEEADTPNKCFVITYKSLFIGTEQEAQESATESCEWIADFDLENRPTSSEIKEITREEAEEITGKSLAGELDAPATHVV